MDGFSFAPIGHIRSCYRDNFGIPRQAGLVGSAESRLVLPKTEAMRQALVGLEDFSHLWVLFLFHRRKREQWKARVRPPRLGGEKTRGVLATRSPLRPNPIGLSVVALVGVSAAASSWELTVAGGDFLDGTPILDLKPYIPYADSIPEARAAWAQEAPTIFPVDISPLAREQLRRLSSPSRPRLTEIILETLRFDPRPSYQRRLHPQGVRGKIWKMRLYDLDIAWQMSDACIELVNVALWQS